MFEKLLNICTKENILKNEPMKNHTTFRTGGPADFLVLPETKEQLKQVLAIIKEENVPLTVIGNGSNLLVSDKGIRGVVVCTCKMKEVSVKGTEITASCGVTMAALAACAKQASLTGLEFASGIPGTVGGGIVMNAGAYDGCLADCATETLCIDLNGNEKRFQPKTFRADVFPTETQTFSLDGVEYVLSVATYEKADVIYIDI